MSVTRLEESTPVKIHKYGNRRLYRTDESRYVTLGEIADLVREDIEFVVNDAKTGKDLTGLVLAQVILDEEKRGVGGGLPVPFLKQLINLRDERLNDFTANQLPRLIEHYLEGASALEHSLVQVVSSQGGTNAALTAELRELSQRLTNVVKELSSE